MTTRQTRSLHAARFLILLLPLASLPLLSQGQSAAPSPAQPPLQFEVISIRPHLSTGDEPSDRRVLPGGRFVATATPLRTLIRIAFGTDDTLISGVPGWADQTFDINAITKNRADVTTPQQFQQLLLSLLEDRFQLKFHREPKEVRVYWLELVKPGKPGPALKPSPPDSQPNMSTNRNGSTATMKVSNASMTDIAAALRRQAGRPVEDHTGLKGNFDFQIEWAPEETPDSTAPSLFTVLKEQLGLKLQSAKGTAEAIVIDQLTHPSAN
ncbi:MAG TPA: TIGR03435 family protein [Edaphobacter sp.]|nr:TIGR03435 family protein [Edaphobacter sp.]HEU5340522.1 TIGR03435 family protein [Edaphobacter sp.]